jgi:hypothetical protein
MQKKSTRNNNRPSVGENEVWLFKELGIYDEDPEKDKKINDDLIKFLESKGYKMAKLKIKGQ